MRGAWVPQQYPDAFLEGVLHKTEFEEKDTLSHCGDTAEFSS